jgi:hypothetical protein
VNADPLDGVTLVAATGIECAALRRRLRDIRIVETGIALAKVRSGFGATVVSCGVAGGLRDDLPTGTVLIPREVRRPDGSLLRCDRDLVELFARSCRRLRIEPVFDPLLTAGKIVRGSARAHWAAQGYAGVDMETGRIDAPRVAAVRVVLDTPQREISSDWQAPLLAILRPWNWPQVLWLAREAPRAAALAASVVVAAQGLGDRMRITRQ